jgi:DNA-binding MarR family transcriptional regulator
MTFKELGSRTLITKGTLTGVVDRLEARGLVARLASPTDGRSTLVRLTQRGEEVFREVFEPHLAFLAPAFESLPECGRKELEKRLRQLREALEKRSDEFGRHD